MLPLTLPIRFLLLALFCVAAGSAPAVAEPRAGSAPVVADQWPQWRGPLATGAAPTATPPVEWSESKNIKWKVKIPGSGTATPVVWDNRVFLLTAIPTGKESGARRAEAPAPEAPAQKPGAFRKGGGMMRSAPPTVPYQFVVLCLDRQTGKTLWQQVAREELPHEGHHPDHGFASHSPVTDGTRVLAYFGSRGLYCYDLAGKRLWQKDLGRMQVKNAFGEGSSPALSGNTVVIKWDHEGDDFIVALDAQTGNERWRQPRSEETSWSTPLVVEHGGQAQVVTTATRRIRSYDLATGKLVWECEGLTTNTIPTPVAGDGLVFATAGFRGNKLRAIRLGRTGDLTDTDAIAWSHDKNTPYVPSPLLSSGRLYFLASNNAVLSCLDAASGKVLFGPERIDGLQGVYASPISAGGHVYLVGRNGVTAVINDAAKLEVVTTNRLDERIDASPAAAGKDLFLRGHQSLYCIAEAATGDR